MDKAFWTWLSGMAQALPFWQFSLIAVGCILAYQSPKILKVATQAFRENKRVNAKIALNQRRLENELEKRRNKTARPRVSSQ